MTNTAPDGSVDPTPDQQTHRPDELENWLTDLRVNLSDDPPDWLTPEDDTADPAVEPTSPPLPADADSAPDADAAGDGAPSDGDVEAEAPGPTVGRHRAVE